MRLTKVLLITPQYVPDIGPSVPIFKALCDDLYSMGIEVTVVTSFPHHSGSIKDDMQKKMLFQEETLDGVRILRTFVYSVPKSAIWRRLVYYSSFNIFSTIAAMKVRKPNIILADSPSLWVGLPLLLRSIFGKIPYIYIVHDIYPDVFLKLGVINNIKLIKLINKIESFFYKRAAHISVLSLGFMENIIRKKVSQKKITIIPACVDIEFFKPLPRINDIREQWNLKDKFVVLYAGNIGLSQGLTNMVEAAKILSKYSDIIFVIVGEGATKNLLIEMVKRMGIKNVKFFQFLEREKVPLIYGMSDICLVSLKRGIVEESVPSKTYTIMASGRPIVATVEQDSEVGKLLNKTGCGICIEPEDPIALASAILTLYRDRSMQREMGKRGRDFVVKHYSTKIATQEYYRLIKEYQR